MKLRLIFALLISILLTGSVYALNNEPAEFAGLKWGDAIQPSFTVLYTSQDGPNKYDLCIKPGEQASFLGETFDRMFYSFVNSRFFRVKFSKKDSAEFAGKLKDALKASLGEDPKEEVVEKLTKYVWTGNVVKILLEYDSEEGEVTLVISSLKTSEFMH